jgi:hypothetical protein
MVVGGLVVGVAVVGAEAMNLVEGGVKVAMRDDLLPFQILGVLHDLGRKEIPKIVTKEVDLIEVVIVHLGEDLPHRERPVIGGGSVSLQPREIGN